MTTPQSIPGATPAPAPAPATAPSAPATVAYFSMEIAVEPFIPTYSGGLGVLAGDTLWSAADLGVPMIGVTLAHHKGYFRQSLDAEGTQSEADDAWAPEEHAHASKRMVSISIEGRRVFIRAFVREIEGAGGHRVPVLFLDTALPENDPWDQRITDHLYGGDDRYRLAQEVVLGMGGVKMLRELGYEANVRFHMNEGHSALLTLSLVEEQLGGHECPEKPDTFIENTRQRCVFTTHTPVPAGHDRFDEGLVESLLGEKRAETLRRLRCLEGVLDMTLVGLRMSRYTNGVARRHAEVSREMFPEHWIEAITNGVHLRRWTADPMAELFDREVPSWRRDNEQLRHAVRIPTGAIREAHASSKRELLRRVAERSGVELAADRFTIGFARRAATYKRPELLFHDLDRLRSITSKHPIQVIYGGKAHPQDDEGKDRIRRVFEAAEALRGQIEVVYLENYEMELAKWVCAGVDLWLNNPTKPREASGTSGMKAAVNGVPSLSVLDGWWIEGHIEGRTGWSIGTAPEEGSDSAVEASSLYEKLETKILPSYYERPESYDEVRRGAIAYNGPFFNTQRMVQQYARNAYQLV